jgi:hypothetical protein
MIRGLKKNAESIQIAFQFKNYKREIGQRNFSGEFWVQNLLILKFMRVVICLEGIKFPVLAIFSIP